MVEKNNVYFSKKELDLIVSYRVGELDVDLLTEKVKRASEMIIFVRKAD